MQDAWVDDEQTVFQRPIDSITDEGVASDLASAHGVDNEKLCEDGDCTCSTVSEFAESCESPFCDFLCDFPAEPHVSTSRPFARWEAAVATANRIATAYTSRQSGSNPTAPNQPQRFSKTKKRRSRPRRSRPIRFEDVQARFLKKHGRPLSSTLKTVLQEPIQIKAAPLSDDVKSRFMEAFAANRGFDRLVPAFHGTNAGLHESIFQRGLLIPGAGNDLRVRNGSAHGLGIYTATVSSPWLSRGFCSAPRMLICGVLDDARAMRDPYRLGSLVVSRESETVRHVGHAIVVFDSCRVAPLFEASAASFANRATRGRAARGTAAASRARALKDARRVQRAGRLIRLRLESAAVAYLLRRGARRRMGH